MRFTLGLALITTVLVGCSTLSVVASAPDVINPVSLSPAVSTNGTPETSVGKVSGTAVASYTDYDAYLARRTTEMHYDSIEPTISENVEGSHQNAINNASIEVEHWRTGLFMLFAIFSKEKTSCYFKGDKVRVKVSAAPGE